MWVIWNNANTNCYYHAQTRREQTESLKKIHLFSGFGSLSSCTYMNLAHIHNMILCSFPFCLHCFAVLYAKYNIVQCLRFESVRMYSFNSIQCNKCQFHRSFSRLISVIITVWYLARTMCVRAHSVPSKWHSDENVWVFVSNFIYKKKCHF